MKDSVHRMFMSTALVQVLFLYPNYVSVRDADAVLFLNKITQQHKSDPLHVFTITRIQKLTLV